LNKFEKFSILESEIDVKTGDFSTNRLRIYLFWDKKMREKTSNFRKKIIEKKLGKF